MAQPLFWFFGVVQVAMQKSTKDEVDTGPSSLAKVGGRGRGNKRASSTSTKTSPCDGNGGAGEATGRGRGNGRGGRGNGGRGRSSTPRQAGSAAKKPAVVPTSPSAPGGSSPGTPHAPVFEPVVSMNSSYMACIESCLRKIQGCEVFADIMLKNPLSQKEGGRESAFELQGFKAAMQASGEAKCGCNLFWQDFGIDHITAHLPINRAKVEAMASSKFKTPTHPADIVIACNGVDFNPLLHRGNLRRLSPGELVHAMVIAMARDVDAGSTATLEAWRKICLTTTMLFVKCESNEDFHFKHLQLRENPGIDFDCVRQSVLQRILDVVQVQKRNMEEAKVTHYHHGEGEF